jgi:hypothetical protein
MDSNLAVSILLAVLWFGELYTFVICAELLAAIRGPTRAGHKIISPVCLVNRRTAPIWKPHSRESLQRPAPLRSDAFIPKING